MAPKSKRVVVRVGPVKPRKDRPCLDSGRRIAPSQLVIHGAGGRIQTEHTYGDDPKRSPG